MNSADKRIEELLNRAGQTINDLPKDYQDAAECMRAYAEVQKWRSENNLSTQHECEKYILHLTDIIDRFEWALENTCNERDYLAYRLNWLSMYSYRDCQLCERFYECERTPDHCLGWVFGGVPEDWSVDDE